ncbi:MAG: hypothetical protein SFW66_08740 [Gammaproteobacteria bacterium]|nr:hypothetical protein [Gammaproteobacteria bacterium]
MKHDQLKNALSKLIDKMKEAGLLDEHADKNEILEKVLDSVENAANEHGIEITEDFFRDEKNLHALMTLTVNAALEKQFENHPTLKDKFNTEALALFLLDDKQSNELKQKVTNNIKQTLALASLVHQKMQPESKLELNEAKDENLLTLKPGGAEKVQESSADLLYEQMYGQDRFGNVHAVTQQITNGAGIVDTIPDFGSGPGGLLEEIERNLRKLEKKTDGTLSDILDNVDELVHTPKSPFDNKRGPNPIST